MGGDIALCSELYTAIMDRANGLKGRYFDSMELYRMGIMPEVRGVPRGGAWALSHAAPAVRRGALPPS